MASPAPGSIGIVIGRRLWWVSTDGAMDLPAYQTPQYLVGPDGRLVLAEPLGHWNENRQGSLLPIIHKPQVTRRTRGKR